MLPLFQRSFPAVEVMTAEAAVADLVGLRVDWQASLSHLGLQLRRDFSSFADTRPFLKADPERTAELRARYRAQAGDRPLVGIAWHSANPEAASYKSATLKDFTRVLANGNVQCVSLQYGEVDKSLGSVRAIAAHPVINDRAVNPLTDMDLFAAQVAAMDRVISVSNTTVHVAGALGMPCLTLVPASYGRTWYWFLGREESPWYPSMRLVRQAKAESWAAVIARAAPEFLGEPVA
jgi:ADP-heptose:LPS heptosyltransferase